MQSEENTSAIVTQEIENSTTWVWTLETKTINCVFLLRLSDALHHTNFVTYYFSWWDMKCRCIRNGTFASNSLSSFVFYCRAKASPQSNTFSQIYADCHHVYLFFSHARLMKRLFTCVKLDEIKTTDSFFAFNLPHNERDNSAYCMILSQSTQGSHFLRVQGVLW